MEWSVMNKETEQKIKRLNERRQLLCEECNACEEEVRMMEDEIEEIDKEIYRLELPPEERGE